MKDLISGLHKVFESRVRLGIMSILMVNNWVDFNELKELLNITDGNLASHLAQLEKNELIEIKKQFIGKKPNTKYNATPKGIKLFKDHLENLNKLINNQ